VTGGKSAHIFTLAMPTLQLLTLSSGWQVNHGSEYQIVIKLSSLNPSANYKHLTIST